MSSDADVAVIARGQLGLVTRWQALEAGLTAGQVKYRLADRRWRAVRRGVFEINGVPSCWEQDVMAACLAAGPGVFASHLTAGRLWGLGLPHRAGIEVVSWVDRRVRQPGVRHHRAQRLADDDVTMLRGIPVTVAARTLVDVAGTFPLGAFGRIVDEALRQETVTLESLRMCHERLATGPGRRRHVAMGTVLAERLPGYRAGGSERELDVDRALRAAGLPPAARQHEIVVDGQIFRVDFAYPAWRIAFEFDGWRHHATFTAFHRDRDRWRRLAAAGWTIVPVTAKTSASDLVADTRRIIARRQPATTT